MARLPRLSVPDQLHLILLRVRGDRAAFADPEAYAAYLEFLRAESAAAGVAIHAFALTPMRVWILATPPTTTALGAMVQAVGRRFVPRFNRRHGTHGGFWQGRFGAAVVDTGECFLDCLRFIETEPVRGGLVERAQDWPWSSAAHHCGLHSETCLTEHPYYWALGNTPFEREARVKELLATVLPDARRRDIEAAAAHGWALGSAEFIEKMASISTRRLRPLPRGRRRLHKPFDMSPFNQNKKPELT